MRWTITEEKGQWSTGEGRTKAAKGSCRTVIVIVREGWGTTRDGEVEKRIVGLLAPVIVAWEYHRDLPSGSALCSPAPTAHLPPLARC